MSPAPNLISAFLSVSPLEPVLVFSSSEDAAKFQSHCKQGRILPNTRQSWVYLPMPKGLLRARTARRGDVAFDFDSQKSAMEFNESIKSLGRIYAGSREDRSVEKVVFLGKEIM